MAKMKGFDLVTMELIRNSMESIIDQMALNITRTAYSPLIREGYDFAAGFCDAQGQLLGEGLTNPVHSLVYPSVIQSIRDSYPDSIRPGDVFIHNDPYSGAAHLPDMYMCKPIFINGKVVAWPITIGHVSDIGGRVAGGNACDSTEIYQEGLRIPAVKFYDQGKLNEALFKIIDRAVRIPDKVHGDMRALLAACLIGERKFLELVETYGWATLRNYFDELMDYSERLVRAEISARPDGVYEFTDHLDNDGFDPDPIRLHIKVRVKGNSIIFDFTGTSPQVRGAINNPLSSTKACVHCALRAIIDPDIPSNSGVWRPVTLIVPEGSVLNPRPPAAVAARGVTMARLMDTLFGAVAKLVPSKVPACGVSMDTGISISGYDREGKAFVFLEFPYGSWGGRSFADGIDASSPIFANAANQPAEMVETEFPLRLNSYSYVPDSGGPGKYRGGLALAREIVFLEERGILQLRTDRHRFPPYGSQGGKPGAPSAHFLNPEGEKRFLGKELLPIKKGDVLLAIVPGAGGWGNPFERDIEAVLEDVRNEKVTIEHARREYGVAIDQHTVQVDADETRRLREAASKSLP